MPTNLERRLASLEDAFAPPRPRTCVLVKGMAPAGHQWVADAYSLPDGTKVARNPDESAAAFEARVTDAALACSTARVVIVFAVGGQPEP